MGHTPGPWKVLHQKPEGNWKPEMFTVIPATNELGDHAAAIVQIYWHRGAQPQDEANARLIAAAPDLLKACELALACLTTDREIDDMIPALKAAIRMAKEGTS